MSHTGRDDTVYCYGRSAGYFVKRVIERNPELLCTSTSESGDSPAHGPAVYGDVKMLQYMYDAIISLNRPQEVQEQMLRQAFERGGCGGWLPIHAAIMSGNIECIRFLITKCPSGRALLEKEDDHGCACAHYVAKFRKVEELKFIIQNAPSGLGVLSMKNNMGEIPLDIVPYEFQELFHPEKIIRSGFEKEFNLLRSVSAGPLVSLIFSIIKDDIELRM